MDNDLSGKKRKGSWRELKLKKRKWKEERLMKKLKKMEEAESVVNQPVEVMNGEGTAERATLSIALPGSILQNAQSNELRTYVAGQIARAACIYKINEVIVFNDVAESFAEPGQAPSGKHMKYCTQFARLLQYLECPQYLRKHFFPIHSDLQFAGLMNPLDAPHHLRQDEDFGFREGITVDKPVKNGIGTFVDVGLKKEVLVDKTLQPKLRVTVKINPSKPESKKIRGIVVAPDTPEKELNTYWGYSVRIAHSISEVFSKSPFKDGYDLTIGTSDKGKSVDEIKKKELRSYRHGLIVFGGLQGLENALESDTTLNVGDVSLLFDHYLNTCPQQGSRTIRTEEAVFITLAELRKKLGMHKK
ncbi:hypothetical protein RUM44_008479 [Polyplax serrata]|uniref:RNA methyltransferase n=1 Tax=Polyplax serrata TaxID=468196 RepID=A0ABR1BCG1_POLSC